MWRTDDPNMQPYVDQLNRMVNTMFDSARNLLVNPNQLVILMGHQPYKCLEIVTNYRGSVMDRVFHGAKVVRVMDPAMFQIVIGVPETLDIINEIRCEEASKMLNYPEGTL